MASQKALPHHSSDWKGYTMDELRYMRAYTAARIEISRDNLSHRLSTFSKESQNGLMPSGLIGKIFSAFSFIDIALLTWKVGSQALKVTRFLRRRK